MPGHYLQLAHSRRFAGGTKIRAALWSGSFVEGWAVYAEEFMADYLYPGEGNPAAMRMQQLKMQLRMIINAILDQRVHAYGMTEAEAMSLMTGRGFQEDGEAAGKWRRAQLTSAQLSTYYVGYTEVADLAAEVAKTSESTRSVHDKMLAHGSPPVRLLRTVLLRPGRRRRRAARGARMSRCERSLLRSISGPPNWRRRRGPASSPGRTGRGSARPCSTWMRNGSRQWTRRRSMSRCCRIARRRPKGRRSTRPI